MDAATAGMSLVGAMVGCGAVGYGLGSLIGAEPFPWGWLACSSESSGAWSLSTLALSGSERAGAGASAILRYLDLILLAVALPVFIAADWPLLGYAVAAGAWVAQRLVLAYTNARIGTKPCRR